MGIDLSSLKVLIKKIFPPNKCVYTVDLDNDGKEDALLIRAINVVIPFEIPHEINIENLSKERIEQEDFNFGEMFQIYLDNEKIDLSEKIIDRQAIQENFFLVHKEESFTLKDILEGKLKGRTIGLGDTVDIVLRINKSNLNRLTEGNHKFRIESEVLPTLKVNFILSEDNFNIKYSFD